MIEQSLFAELSRLSYMTYKQVDYNRRLKARKDAAEYLPYDRDTLERTLPTLESLDINSHKDFRLRYFKRDFALKAPHQDEWDLLIDERRQLIILSFRGGGKSVFFSRSYPLYFMLSDLNKATLLITETDDLSKGYTSSLVEEMLKNPKLVNDFNTPALFDPMKGRQGYSRHEIHLKRAYGRKEDSFKAIGLGRKMIGYHPDLLVLDDIVQEGKSRMSAMQVESWFDKVVLPMRTPTTKTLIIGTRKDPEDIYDYIMSKGTFERSIQTILNEVPEYKVERGADGKMITDIHFTDDYWNVYNNARVNVKWPQRYTLKEVCLIREEMGAIAFSGEMMNNPVVQEGIEFEREWLKYYDFDKMWINNTDVILRMRIYMGVDVGGASKESDYSVIATIGVLGSNIYILRINQGHWKIPTLLREINNDYLRYASSYGNKPLIIGIEKNFMQKAVVEYLDEFTLLPVKGYHQQVKKKERISALQTYFERQRVFVDTKSHGYARFLAQYLNYPQVKNDDILDAIELAIQLATLNKPSHFGVYR